jgi:hypothetical protein
MSPSVRDIFATDGRKYAARLRAALGDPAGPDTDGARRAARRLHHGAVLASHEPVIHAATALQKTAIQVIAGRRTWTTELLEQTIEVLDRLDVVIASLPAGDPEAESHLRSAADGLSGPASGAAPDENEPRVPAPRLSAADEASAELDALAADLEGAVERLENDPRDREPLKAMLRRIRRLRELGAIEAVSPADRALSAVEELILQIADLNATVGPGYLTVFRHAREVLDDLREKGPTAPSVTIVGGRAVEVDRLKESVMEKARRARQVVWVSDLFYAEGPHIVACPLAERQAGSLEEYFRREAGSRLERSEGLRRTMLESDAEQMRLAGESLAQTLRHLRERAAAFNHGPVGRVTRRAAAALRVQLVRPPSRIRRIAVGLEEVFTSLRTYLDTTDHEERARAIAAAERALHLAILGDIPEVAASPGSDFDPDAALQQALALRTRVDDRLKRLSGPDVETLRHDLEELFDLLARYVSASAEHH